ncbi:hypothetical protein BKA70DRAFT_1494568 [Coprinopsis sp. MPI-PUGE-AT-0042]|nr:hypothetical protein BKA70DRAFT_1494568 [Coprinopsis sp. MPI-PUGE-AT-0042]
MASPAPNILQAIPPALTFLVPLFALVLLVVALSHQPARYAERGRRHRIVTVYLAIGCLAVLAGLDGALGLKTVLGGSGVGHRGKGELVVETLMFSAVGASAIYLLVSHADIGRKIYWLAALSLELGCAFVVALASSLVKSRKSLSVASCVLWLLFTVTVLPVVVLARGAKQRTNNASVIQLQAPIRTSSFSATQSHFSTARTIEHRPTNSSLDSSSSSGESHGKYHNESTTGHTTVVEHLHTSYPPRREHMDVEDSAGQGAANLVELGRILPNSRLKSLLVLIAASQGAASVAFLLEIVAITAVSSADSSVISAPSTADTPVSSAYAVLQIVRTALMDVCVTGIMAAFLLHAYNAGQGSAASRCHNPPNDAMPPPAVDLSRVNAITVSLSTTTTTAALPIGPSKRRTSSQACTSPRFDQSTKKLCMDGRFTDIALSAVQSQVVFTKSNLDDRSYEGQHFDGETSKGQRSRQSSSSSSSSSSSFECSLSRKMPSNSMLMSPEPFPSSTVHDSVRDSKFDHDEDHFEPGFAYIYSGNAVDANSADALDVGLPVPFGGQTLYDRKRGFITSAHSPPLPPKPRPTLDTSFNNSMYTNEAVENSFSSRPLASPPHTPTAPITIPLPKSAPANPYPTPRSTPTATSFIGNPTALTFLASPASPICTPPRRTTSSRSVATTNDSSHQQSHCSEPTSAELQRRYRRCTSASCSHDTSPTPTPTRAPTPGLSLTPFLGSHIRKRDSTTSSQSHPQTPSPTSPSSFLASLKGKSKKTSPSKRESALSQGLEGIRNGLGSSGKTKYPLRSSNSQSSLGLAISSGFRFPQLTRRASEIDKGAGVGEGGGGGRSPGRGLGRNPSSSTLTCSLESPSVDEVDEGDFMDLRDPFAPSLVPEGQALRICSPEEINLRSGRESRVGYDQPQMTMVDGWEKDGQWDGSIGRARGQRVSGSQRAGYSPTRSTYSYHSNPNSPTRASSPSASKALGLKPRLKERKATTRKTKLVKSEGSSPSHQQQRFEVPRRGVDGEEVDVALEEAKMLAQQLLAKLDAGCR